MLCPHRLLSQGCQGPGRLPRAPGGEAGPGGAGASVPGNRAAPVVAGRHCLGDCSAPRPGRGRQLRPGKGSPGEAGTPTDPAPPGPPRREAASSDWGVPAWVSPRGISLRPLEGRSPPPPHRCVFWNVLCPPAPSHASPLCLAAGLGAGVICPENKQTRKTTVRFLGAQIFAPLIRGRLISKTPAIWVPSGVNRPLEVTGPGQTPSRRPFTCPIPADRQTGVSRGPCHRGQGLTPGSSGSFLPSSLSPSPGVAADASGPTVGDQCRAGVAPGKEFSDGSEPSKIAWTRVSVQVLAGGEVMGRPFPVSLCWVPWR